MSRVLRMQRELLELRLVVYSTAASFHHAMAEYFSALHRHVETAKITQELFDAGTEYLFALNELLEYLLKLTTTAEVEAEIERTRRILALLDFEMSLIRG